jgi:hypothetical protein
MESFHGLLGETAFIIMDIVLIILGIIFLFMLVTKNKTLREIYMITSFYDVDLEI